ncbi:MAG: hypothetical protein U9N52_08245 [Campylobacterota bacterium]|nr:hypothetical protein [Campylobacterota bacterium]
MELKDVILSTLAEMDNSTQDESELVEVEKEKNEIQQKESSETSVSSIDEEQRYLEGIRERLLVLFEGFQSPNNTQIEAKVDLTLNFLEYLLATIDTRLDKLK